MNDAIERLRNLAAHPVPIALVATVADLRALLALLDECADVMLDTAIGIEERAKYELPFDPARLREVVRRVRG